MIQFDNIIAHWILFVNKILWFFEYNKLNTGNTPHIKEKTNNSDRLGKNTYKILAKADIR